MSIKLMTAIWDMEFSPVEKLVFLALADCANDEGLAWPSIATIARKTGAGERTVQRAIREGEKQGLIRREEVIGKGCKYIINPRHSDTPATMSPVTNATKTPATVTPHPRHSDTQTINEPSRTVKPIKCASTIVSKPDDVSGGVWRDWLAHRKTAFSQTALDGFVREAGKAGWPLEAAIIESIERGWQGFKADWVKDKQNGNHGRNQTDGMGRTERAAIRALNDLGLAPSEMGGSRTPRPTMPVPRIYADRGAEPNALLAIGHDRE